MADYHNDIPRNPEISNPIQQINVPELRRRAEAARQRNLGSAATFASETQPIIRTRTPVHFDNLADRHEFEHIAYPVARRSEASPLHPDHNDDRAFASPIGYIGIVDGVGGQKGSEQAAAIAANLIGYQAEFIHPHANPAHLAAYLGNGIYNAHKAIMAKNAARKGEGLDPIATTATAAAITLHEGKRFVAWTSVGDSRLMAYRPSRSQLQSLTLDETGLSAHKPHAVRAQEQQDLDGVRTIAEYDALPRHRQVSYDNRHQIAYALGVQIPEDIQRGYQEVEEGDIVFAVSDAYTDNFTQQEITQMIQEAIENNGGAVDVQQITARMTERVQWFMRHHRETDSIRGKPDDASVAMIGVV